MTLLGETSVPNFDNGTVARTVASDTRRPLIESCMYGPFSHLYIGEQTQKELFNLTRFVMVVYLVSIDSRFPVVDQGSLTS